MINKEEIEINGKIFIKTASDTYKIKKVGTLETYDEAYDLTNNVKYEETNELLTKEENKND